MFKFIAYLTAGDGGCAFTVEAALALIEGGASCLEIGVPFSDPIADGPVIQRAMQRALANHTTATTCLEIIAKIRARSDVPIILFSYYNPIFQQGPSYLKELKSAGGDGALIVDLPVFEAKEWTKQMAQNELKTVFTISPSTKEDTLKTIEKYTTGFLYYVSRKGTTGMQQGFPEGFHETIKAIKKKVSLPVVTGFGISSREMAEEALQSCDGFVVGSYFVAAIERGASPKELMQMARNLKREVTCS